MLTFKEQLLVELFKLKSYSMFFHLLLIEINSEINLSLIFNQFIIIFNTPRPEMLYIPSRPEMTTKCRTAMIGSYEKPFKCILATHTYT